MAMRTWAGGLLAVAVVLAGWEPGAAEPFLDVYTGKNFTRNSDLRISQDSRGNSFTVQDLAFDDDAFNDPPWYGVRAGYFFEQAPWLGLALEFFHFKIIGDTGETRTVTGTHNGAPIDAAVRVDSIVQQFQITHGVNYLMVDAIARYPLLRTDDFPDGRAWIYGGVGVGPVIAHAESRIDDVKGPEEYELGGLGLQAFLGARFMVFKYVGLFAEYKFTYSDLEVGVAGGKARLDETSHHIVGGITVRFPSF